MLSCCISCIQCVNSSFLFFFLFCSASTYGIDKQRSPRSCSAHVDSCNKHYSGHPTLTPGVFTLYCPHGICYGFEVMTHHESPKIPFNIFLTRFRTAPSLIIYDNACQLHRYCLNREPHFFNSSVFAVDRLHWDNHVGCSEGYNLNIFNNKYDIAKINSQVNEQANVGLGKLRASLAYMAQEKFMFHAGLYLGLRNRQKQALLGAST
eukprot:scpid25894/ scgid5378/ 